jgi:hypothetical protein
VESFLEDIMALVVSRLFQLFHPRLAAGSVKLSVIPLLGLAILLSPLSWAATVAGYTPAFDSKATSVLKNTARLYAIQAYSGTTLVTSYPMKYEISPVSSKPRISDISRCDGNSSCLLSASLSWSSNSVATFTVRIATTICANGSAAYGVCNDSDNYTTIQYPDINGDGRADLCYRSDTGIQCFLANGSGWDLSSQISTDICANGSAAYGVCNDADNYNTISYADINGDGKADLIYRGDLGIQLWFSTGNGFVNRVAYNVCANGAAAYGVCNDADNHTTIRFPDINGDGRADLCYRSDTGVRCYLANRSGWDLTSPIITDICANGSVTYGVCNDSDNFTTLAYVDVSGDGEADLVYRGDQGIQVWFSNGGGFENRQAYSICANGSAAYGACNDADNHTMIRYPDINGDGKADLCFRSDSGMQCFLGNGIGLDLASQISTNICANGSAAYRVCNDSDNYSTIGFADINGDGKADLIYRADQGIQVWLSTGTGFANRQSYDICANGSAAYGVCNDADNYAIQTPDVNGDRLPDLLYRGDQGIQVWTTSTGFPDLLL